MKTIQQSKPKSAEITKNRVTQPHIFIELFFGEAIQPMLAKQAARSELIDSVPT